jgi:hypothetical protein
VPPLIMALLVSEKLLVFAEPGFTTGVVDGVTEVGERTIVVAGGFGSELGGLELEPPGTMDEVGGFGADGIDELVTTVEEVFSALTGLGLGRGAGRAGPFGRGAIRVAALVAARAPVAMVPVAPVTMAVRAITEANQRGDRFSLPCSFARGEFGFWFMPSRYGLVLKSPWESQNSFHTDPQRSLRLGS